MHVFLIAAITADGYIGRDKSHKSTRWTSEADAAFFSRRTKKAGAMVMGSTTFATIGNPLPDRKIFVYTSKPEKLEQFHPDQVEPVSLEPVALVDKVESAGYRELAICGGASIYSQFMKAGVIETIYLTIEPVLFGEGIRLFSEPLVGVDIKLKKLKQLSKQTVLLEYGVNYE